MKLVFLGTLLAEGLGALLLSIRFVPQLGLGQGIYYGVWHSVSAFCNAGFDLMGPVCGEYASFTAYAGDPLVSLTICALILFGGTGFLGGPGGEQAPLAALPAPDQGGADHEPPSDRWRRVAVLPAGAEQPGGGTAPGGAGSLRPL